MATTKNWLGIDFSFDNVADKVSSSATGVGLLQCGLYKAVIEKGYATFVGQKNTPCLTIEWNLEDFGKKITNNLWLTKLDDSDSANMKNLKNFLSRVLFEELTEADYKALPKEEVNDACMEFMTKLASNKEYANILVGKKALIDLTQNPFISRDRDTKEIKLTNKNKKDVLSELPQQLVKVIEEQENLSGMIFGKLPEFAFKNEIKMYGIHFYNDYKEDAKFYDTKAYEYVQKLKEEKKAIENTMIGDEEIPFG